MNIDDKLMWYWLSCVMGIGWNRISTLLEFYGGIEQAFYADECSIMDLVKVGFPLKVCEDMICKRNINVLHDNYERMKSRDIKFYTYKDPEYPNKLLNLNDSPYYIFVRGKLPDGGIPAISVIGSRFCSDYGREMALYFSEKLAEVGIQIISGLAKGIDGISHSGALKCNGLTFGVLGSGIDVCYPKENYNLFRDIENTGGIISEYGPGVPGIKYNFPYRNRIIAGLSDGILVIEAAEKSGTLITVDFGLTQGKSIYCIPGRIGDKLSVGCNNLIKMGAKLVTSPEEIIEEYPDYLKLFEGKHGNKDKLTLETTEKIVYAYLDLYPKHIEKILERVELPLNELLLVLVSLELKGYIQQTEKNYYVRAIDIC